MVGTTGWERRLRALVVVLVLALSGCGAIGLGGSSATPSASPTPTHDPNKPAPKAPKGYGWASAPKSSIRVPIPTSWEVVAIEDLLASDSSGEMAKAAESFGFSTEQFDSYVRTVDALAFGPRSGSFRPNINVVPLEATRMPTTDEVAAQLKTIGGKPGTGRTATSPVGPALVVPYTLKVSGTTIQGRSILIDGPGTFANITVSHTTAKGADQVTAAILRYSAAY